MIEQICATKKSGLVDVYGALPCLSLSHLNGSVLFVSLLRCTFQIACVRYSFRSSQEIRAANLHAAGLLHFFFVRFEGNIPRKLPWHVLFLLNTIWEVYSVCLSFTSTGFHRLNFSLFSFRTFLKYLLKLKMLESDCHKCT